MRRFYQESWQGIPFTAISHLSFFHLAESKFYSVFYEELFHRYSGWNDLPEAWRRGKQLNADWIVKRLQQLETFSDEKQSVRVLSIGSGVGFMEHLLLEKLPDLELHVNEPSTVGMRWLREYIPAERIYIGLPPNCLPPDVKYDLIYLSAVDYGIAQKDFAFLLGELRAQLKPGGKIICLSASLLEEDSLIGGFVNALKIGIRAILHFLGIRRQQFWGWRRTRAEYRQLFRQAGFSAIEDGLLDDGVDTYWIAAE